MKTSRKHLFAAAVLLPLALATLTACDAGQGSVTVTGQAGPAGVGTAPATTRAAAPTGVPTAAATTPAAAKTTKAAAAPVVRRTADYSPIPEGLSANSGMDFGILTKVVSSGGVVTLTVDRAQFYTGAEAIAHNNGVAPDNDYLVSNANTKKRSFVLDPKASVMGSYILSGVTDGSFAGGRVKLTPGQFVKNAQKWLKDQDGVLIWLRHTDGLSGPVTAVAEQFVP